MAEHPNLDYYETLQVSPRADTETIERVYRHLAKRYHPDNLDSGDVDRFTEVTDAFRVLTDPEARAHYDVRYDEIRQARWKVFDQATTADDMAADHRLREALLSVLYTARRNDADRPGMGMVDLEQLLGCPEEHMKFHLWYLRENGWIQRMENGTIAITAAGVDRVIERGGPAREGAELLMIPAHTGASPQVTSAPAAYATHAA